MDRLNQTPTIIRGRPVTSSNAAHANEYFEHFLNASTLKTILGYYRNICDLLHLKPNVYPQFYPKLRANLTSWRAKALWKKFDARSSHKCYGKGKSCPNTRVLIIGAGPCGLRAAIEAQLLGAKVVVVEKRDRMSRNNVLHLWPFVIEDLRALGAKKFFGKFCAGSIDHISIRQLQCILLKAALLLGVEVHTEVGFERLIEPNLAEKTGWKAECKPLNHPISQYEFDVIIGADGKRNTLQGFKRKEFRGKLAIAITANFINKRTEAEAIVEEISGVAFIFNQKFFKDLFAETGIDLENIVYYKDDTHYFVMTAKKPSLIEKGVIKQDLADTERLLAPDNVNREALMNYAREAAEFSTNYQLPDLEFAVNHYGQPDVAMFDFTSMYAAENASKIVERNGYQLLMILVGDSLLEPFWPTGSGCARGFLSSLDAGWAIRSWGSGSVMPLEVLAERESIYRLLAQTTPDNLNKDWKAYTLDPATRYPNLNKNVVLPHQILSLFDSDNPKNMERMRRNSQELMLAKTELPRKRRREEIDNDVLVSWIREQVKEHEDLTVTDIGGVFKDGRILCAIINRYRPDLLDYSAINRDEPAINNQIAFDVLEKELGIVPVMTGEEMTKTDDYLTMALYLTQVYDTFRCEIPHIKHPKLVKTSSKKTIEIPLPPSKGFPKESFLPKYILKTPSQSKTKSDAVASPSANVKPITVNKCFPRKTPFDFWLQQNKPVFTNELIMTPDKSIDERLGMNAQNEMSEDFNKTKIVVVGDDLGNKHFNKTTKPNQLHVSKSDTLISQESFSKFRFFDENFKEYRPSTSYKKKCLRAWFKKTNDIRNESRHLNPKHIKIRLIEDNVYNTRKIKQIKFDGNLNLLFVSPEECSEIFPHDVPLLLRGFKKKAGCVPVMKNNRKKCHWGFQNKVLNLNEFKFLFASNMSENKFEKAIPPEQVYDRVVNWLNVNDFNKEGQDSGKEKHVGKPKEALHVETNIIDGLTDITSITKTLANNDNRQQHLVLGEKTHVVKCEPVESILDDTPKTSQENFAAIISNFKVNGVVKTLSRLTSYAPCQIYANKIKGDAAKKIPIILEGEESELPESKRHESTFAKFQYNASKNLTPQVLPPIRPSSRHKRHADAMTQSKPAIVSDRKTRKRRTLEKVGASVGYLLGCATGELPRRQVSQYITSIEERLKCMEDIVANRCDRQTKRRQQRKLQTENFIKSMQMLQANAKSDHSGPFEDYSIFLYRQTAPNFEDRVKDLERKFTYIPDRETKLPVQSRGEKDEDFVARIKDLEDKWKEPVYTEKKPKDLLRAIGKIETSDWNIKEIEKKIMENKLGKTVNKDKEKVPKWSREQFLARQTKMEKQHLDRQDSAEAKFAVIDKSIKQLEQKLKEGTARDLGQNKVASITEKFVNKTAVPEKVESKPVQRSNSRVALPTQGGSEYCHFCNKRVYLMERLSAEGRFFHHGCFRCQYCNTQLRLGSYSFDRDGQYGHKFFCVHHYGMQGEIYSNKVTRKVSQRLAKSPEKKPFGGVTGLDLLDRVQTPERIEFANLNENALSDHEESPSQMDEDEWTDRNFGASTAELGSSDDESSSLSETDSDDEGAYEEALEEPVTKEGTLKWAERWKQRYLRKRNNPGSDGYSSSDQSSYYENSSEDDDSETATEGEEEIRARELRKQEVRVEPPLVHTDTGTDTEIASDESSSESSSEIHNSATEISTDSEFAQDDPTPTSELPSLAVSDFYVTKTRGSYGAPKKIQVTSGFIHKSNNGKAAQKQDIELKLTPLVPSSSVIRKPAPILLPRNEGYALNRTQSTGGIAARVSLELKKKYLLGETNAAGSIQKSGSASTLDTKLKSFHTNISDCQKLLKPASDAGSTNMQSFSNKLNEILAAQLQKTKTDDSIIKDVEVVEVGNPVIEIIKNEENDEKNLPQVVNECEGRPRSPLHEASIVVPQIDWSKHNNEEDYADSLTESEDLVEDKPKVNIFVNIPRVEVHDANGEILHDDMTLDSLCVEPNKPLNSLSSEAKSFTSEKDPKSITSEKKSLNQPKTLPNLEREMPDIHVACHMKQKPQESASGLSTPSNSDSCTEQVTAALTETELSDWARDGTVSDDFQDVEFELNPDLINTRKHKKPKHIKFPRATEAVNIAKIGKFDEIGHICGKDNSARDLKRKVSITETFNNVLNPNLDNIEFMDTGTETSSDDGLSNTNNGYVQFKNEDDIAEDSLSPTINQYIDKNVEKNTGFCIIANESNNFGSEVIDLKPTDLFKAKQNLNVCEHEEDSLLIIDTGTTTEENTCSDSTVKNVTERQPPKELKEENSTLSRLESSNLKRQELENRLAKVKEERAAIEQAINKSRMEKNLSRNEYEEHCQRLQSKVEFGNVKDSIDIRKSRRKSKSDSPPKPDLIQEENCPPSRPAPKDITLNLTAAVRTPTTFYKREEIQKERDINQKLIQEMVMNKMKAQNKSLERKKRNRNSFSPNRPFELTKSATTDISLQLNSSNDTNCSIYATPDVIIPAINKSHPLQKSLTTTELNRANESLNSSNEVFATPISDFKRPLSLYTNSFTDKKLSETQISNPSLPDIQKALFQDNFKTPVAPPRQKHEEAKRTAEKLKQNARARARLLSNEELGLSPEDKLEKLREKMNKREKENIDVQDSIESLVVNTEKRNSLLYSNDTLSKKRNNSFRRSRSGDSSSNNSEKVEMKLSILKNANECPDKPTRTKSVSEICKNFQNAKTPSPLAEKKLQFCKSDPNLLEDSDKGSKKKWKDRERKFSKLFATFFAKRKEVVGDATPTSSRGFLARISPKAKAKSKDDGLEKMHVRRQSFSETTCPSRSSGDVSPPPIPPLPTNYTGSRLQGDESSDGENDWKHRSSCDTLDQSGLYDGSTSSLASRKTNRSARKAVRHAHLKRHRMAQEIQRKLEETEVKTRELEQRGVLVEKALRGETSGDAKDESELLQEWFDLMRDRTELRRYEKELMVRAQELELEDRHARLQHELRDRLEKDDEKSKYDAEIERSIIDEMMEIVKKRDSLIALLEEDRIRYSEEDRDFEEQMLAKGLRLTPIRKTPEK